MLSVGKNVSECLKLHLRGSDILRFSREAGLGNKPSSYSSNKLKCTFTKATTI